jgi:parvulin-like peptidyl-prolyl isomerase
MKALRTCAWTALVFLGVVGEASAARADEGIRNALPDEHVLAKVDDHAITVGEVRRSLGSEPTFDSLPDVSSAMRFQLRQIVDSLIDEFLELREAQKLTAGRIREHDVEAEMKKRLQRDFDGNERKFEGYLRSIAKTRAEYRQIVADDMALELARAEFRAKVDTRIESAEIEKYYAENRERFRVPAGVRLLAIKLSPSAEHPENPRQRAAAIMTRLRAGEDFGALAREFSEDSRRRNGGVLGWFTRADLREELANATFALEPGRFSEPVPVNRDVFILFVADKRAAGIPALTDIRDQVERVLVNQRLRDARKRWIDDLRSHAQIHYFD